MNLIVRSANELILSILKSRGFSFVSYVPSVLLKCVSDEKDSFQDYTNVRICIIGFNKIDYQSYYSEIIKSYKSGKSDISHLVAIDIDDSERIPRFALDTSGNFDVIVHTSIADVDNILTSIMLDISLYHYFSLSHDINDRKQFNKIKFEYLKAHFERTLQEKTYGSVLGDKPIYLPFSLDAIKALARRKKAESRNETINELIMSFGDFILHYLSYEIRCNIRGSILHADEHRSKIKMFGDLQKYVEKYIKDNSSAKEFYLIVFPEVTKIGSISNVEFIYDSGKYDSSKTKELFESMASVDNYQIVKVIKEEDA